MKSRDGQIGGRVQVQIGRGASARHHTHVEHTALLEHPGQAVVPNCLPDDRQGLTGVADPDPVAGMQVIRQCDRRGNGRSRLLGVPEQLSYYPPQLLSREQWRAAGAEIQHTRQIVALDQAGEPLAEVKRPPVHIPDDPGSPRQPVEVRPGDYHRPRALGDQHIQ